MTIDPVATVTPATDGVSGPAANVDPAASADATISPQSTQAPVADQGARVDLYDYASKNQHTPPAIDTLIPESQAKYLANPAELGERVLEKMESFHQRAMDYQNDFQNGAPSFRTNAASGGDGVMAGPAEQHVAGTANAGSEMIDSLRRVMDYAIETTMVTTSSSQFTKTVNTLMKGQ